MRRESHTHIVARRFPNFSHPLLYVRHPVSKRSGKCRLYPIQAHEKASFSAAKQNSSRGDPLNLVKETNWTQSRLHDTVDLLLVFTRMGTAALSSMQIPALRD